MDKGSGKELGSGFSHQATGQAIVQTRGLGKQVSMAGTRLTLLEDINLSIRAGESVAVLGRSGSGKSTLLSLMAGLDVPTEGDVSLLGETISTLDEDGRARVRSGRVGFVFQAFQLLPAFTARENVMLPLELAGTPDAAAQADALLAQVGLAARAHHRPTELSGGEQQRIALARAFAGRPQVLFADEPTGNLDAATGQQVIDLLFRMNAEFGATLIMVTHDPQLAARCDRRIHLEYGKLVEDTAV